jgi:hypothetical protein
LVTPGKWVTGNFNPCNDGIVIARRESGKASRLQQFQGSLSAPLGKPVKLQVYVIGNVCMYAGLDGSGSHVAYNVH